MHARAFYHMPFAGSRIVLPGRPRSKTGKHALPTSRRRGKPLAASYSRQPHINSNKLQQTSKIINQRQATHAGFLFSRFEWLTDATDSLKKRVNMDATDIDVSGIVDGAAPPKTVGLQYEVTRIVSCTPRHFVVLAEKGFGAWFHWKGRSVKCLKPEPCERCGESDPKWRCYMHSLELIGALTKSVIIELTLPAVALIEIQLNNQPLRGSQVRLSKTKGGKHGRFVVEVLPKRISGTTLPMAHDVAMTMNKLWEINERWDCPDAKK